MLNPCLTVSPEAELAAVNPSLLLPLFPVPNNLNLTGSLSAESPDLMANPLIVVSFMNLIYNQAALFGAISLGGLEGSDFG